VELTVAAVAAPDATSCVLRVGNGNQLDSQVHPTGASGGADTASSSLGTRPSLLLRR